MTLRDHNLRDTNPMFGPNRFKLGIFSANCDDGLDGPFVTPVIGMDMHEIEERASQRAASLSGGEQQMLATGRALMSQPTLLLDEPTTGPAPIIVNELGRILRELNAAGLTILVVEQNVRMALKLADDVYIMRGGGIVLHAPAADLQNNDKMFSSCLG